MDSLFLEDVLAEGPSWNAVVASNLFQHGFIVPGRIGDQMV
jgi:hypothetical protein